ncbi:MAG: hypothetical protein ACH34V_00040 [Flavobacterium sp.]|uniref:hypothetical protein n=1 Tax=Flavobacterium sp. TaxID=239 RepID=UPI0037AAB892
MTNYIIIANNINAIRNLKSTNFNLPKDSKILNAFEDLCVNVLENYIIPNSHLDYTYESFGIEKNLTQKEMLEKIKLNHKKLENFFSIELQLRAIECIFNWGEPEKLDYSKIKELRYLIARLHHLVGNCVYGKI